ncbi:Uncharacterised protein [Mycobacteroides abscessus subsp. bolletii]|nr:Uncharacterised protein [Mycobacteroides abscessus subsp. bolletii]
MTIFAPFFEILQEAIFKRLFTFNLLLNAREFEAGDNFSVDKVFSWGAYAAPQTPGASARLTGCRATTLSLFDAQSATEATGFACPKIRE